MVLPEGLVLGKGRNTWLIGREVGSGVCGTVHELKSRDGDNNDEYVVKVTQVPPASANPKKKKSAAQKNADLLYYESLMYRTHLPGLQGILIPRVPVASDPSSPPFFGDEGGFRYMVMERMEGTLMDAIPELVQQSKSKKKIAFGPIAVALVDCIQAVHEGKFLFVDVKPENFMLASSSGKLHTRIRMIDLGLVKRLNDVSGKHKQNEKTQLVGTPLYSSLNVHDGETLSRRDDLEATGYVVAELLLTLLAQVAGGNKKRKNDASATLPWSQGTSDDDIHRIKKEQVEDPESDFFANLSVGGNDNVSDIMWAYLEEVRDMDFKEKPDYHSLKAHLKGLNVVASSRSTAAAKKPTPNKRKGSRRRKQAESSSEESDSESSPEVKRSSGRKRPSPKGRGKSPKVRRVAEDSDDEPLQESKRRARRGGGQPSSTRFVLDMDESEDESEKAAGMDIDDSGSEKSEQTMDWVQVSDDENRAPSNGSSKPKGVNILVTAGPHRGESFSLRKDSSGTVVLGSNPSERGSGAFRLADDAGVDASHAKLVIDCNKKMCSVRVLDLKSSSGTFVGGVQIRKGKEHRAFINDEIRVGDSTLKIRPLTAKDEETPKKRAARSATAARTSRAKAAKKDPPPRKARSEGPGVRLCFIEGPHKGESHVLQEGMSKTVLVGTNPTGSSREALRIRDSKAAATHAKLELITSKQLCSVQVTDLKSRSGIFVNGKKMDKGKRRVFINETLRFGESVVQVKPL